jgi:hypothetical protein
MLWFWINSFAKKLAEMMAILTKNINVYIHTHFQDNYQYFLPKSGPNRQ